MLLLLMMMLLHHHLLHRMRMRCVMLRHHGRVLLLPSLCPNRHMFLSELNVSPPAYTCRTC